MGIKTELHVFNRVFADVYLLRKRALTKVKQSATQAELVIHFVIEARSEQRLGLKAKERIIFKRYVYRNSRIQYALIDDFHLAQRIINGIILPFHQLPPARGHFHG